jgi:hypothetical protein
VVVVVVLVVVVVVGAAVVVLGAAVVVLVELVVVVVGAVVVVGPNGQTPSASGFIALKRFASLCPHGPTV